MTRKLIVTLAVLVLSTPAQAGLGGKAAQELAEFVMKKFGGKVATEGAEHLAGRLAGAAARHGDEVLTAVRKVGPVAITLADDAGTNAPSVLRLLSRYGDDAARVLSGPQGLALVTRYGDDAASVLIRHQGIAAPVLEKFGEPAITALGALGPQAGRRMAILTGDLAGSGHAPELMGVIGRFGDPAMEFIWKHKGILAGGTALVAFLANPEPYLSGAANITHAVGETTVKPAVAAAGNIIVVAAVGLTVVLGIAVQGGLLKRLPLRLAVRMAGEQSVKRAAGRARR